MFEIIKEPKESDDHFICCPFKRLTAFLTDIFFLLLIIFFANLLRESGFYFMHFLDAYFSQTYLSDGVVIIEKANNLIVDLNVFFIVDCSIIFLFTWLYFAFSESSKIQATPGKYLLNLKVINSDNNRISFKKATLRFFSMFLSIITFFAGIFMIFFNNEKDTMHDRISKTHVVSLNCKETDTNEN